MRELVHEDDLRLALERGVEIEFVERRAAVFDLAARRQLQAVQQHGGLGALVRLDDSDHDVDALGSASRAAVSIAYVLPTPATRPGRP